MKIKIERHVVSEKWNDVLFNDTANPCLGHIVSY